MNGNRYFTKSTANSEIRNRTKHELRNAYGIVVQITKQLAWKYRNKFRITLASPEMKSICN
jgi:hypothetical protein